MRGSEIQNHDIENVLDDYFVMHTMNGRDAILRDGHEQRAGNSLGKHGDILHT